MVRVEKDFEVGKIVKLQVDSSDYIVDTHYFDAVERFLAKEEEERILVDFDDELPKRILVVEVDVAVLKYLIENFDEVLKEAKIVEYDKDVVLGVNEESWDYDEVVKDLIDKKGVMDVIRSVVPKEYHGFLPSREDYCLSELKHDSGDSPYYVEDVGMEKVLCGWHLKKSILEFYKLTLKYSMQKIEKERVGLWREANEKYFLNLINKEVVTGLRFAVAAILGELRHTLGCVYRPVDGWKRYRLAAMLSWMFGVLKLSRIPSDRSCIYQSEFEEHLWLPLLYVAKELFSKFKWASNMGGFNWGRATKLVIKTYEAVIKFDSDVIIHYDTLINLVHNTGKLLDKFDCLEIMDIDRLLDLKQDGELEKIEKLLNVRDSNFINTVCMSCPRFIWR